MSTIRKVLIAALLAVLTLIPISMVKGATQVAAEQRGDRVYETPCYHRERLARGIPGDLDAYVAWYRANQGTATWRSWNAAMAACKRNEPVARWDWGAMVRIR